MEDYQRWRRREINRESAKPKPDYRFMPNRTAGQTFAMTVLTGFGVMGFTALLYEYCAKRGEKINAKVERQYKLMKTHVPAEYESVMNHMLNRGDLEKHRMYLNLPSQPPATALISDPDIKYPQPKGQMTL